LQALDEEHLKVDAQFGGVDQRKIFVFAEKVNTVNENRSFVLNSSVISVHLLVETAVNCRRHKCLLSKYIYEVH